jgi:hypothetical protein
MVAIQEGGHKMAEGFVGRVRAHSEYWLARGEASSRKRKPVVEKIVSRARDLAWGTHRDQLQQLQQLQKEI